jgi:hypothetical protein
MARCERIAYLLQGPTLALHNEEIDEKPAENVASGEDIAVLEINGGNNEGSEEGDQEVPKPIASGR